jgi:hypothetical protein
MDEDEFRSITFQLKQQGVTVIGADSQLTEKTMKLVNLVPLKEGRVNGPFNYKTLSNIARKDDSALAFVAGNLVYESGFFISLELDGLDPNDPESFFGLKEDGENVEVRYDEVDFIETSTVDEGSCGYAPEGEDPNEAEQPAGSHLLRKKIREMIESYVDDPNVPGTSGMEDAVNDPNAKAEKILMQLAKVFPDVPLSKIVNDSSYKRQAVTQILFGMMS